MVVYMWQCLLYKVQKSTSKGVKFRYCWDDNELEELKEIGPGYSIVRFKGLGEMQSDQLWETTMNPKTRTLMQLQLMMQHKQKEELQL